MCNFFSFCGDGYGNWKYSDWPTRVALGHSDKGDSHTAILTRAGIPVDKQHLWSCYEYNPLTRKFVVDQGVPGHDHPAARGWVEAVDWSSIVAPLVVKPIVSPLKLGRCGVTRLDKRLLREWASVYASVGDSVYASVGDSVYASVGDSVWASVGGSVGDSVGVSVCGSVWASVRDSVRGSVRDSVGGSVGGSVWASVRDSVWDSVGGYLSSFFRVRYQHDYSSAIRLWERGLVASWDGKTWRLHGGKAAEVVYEWTPKEGT